MSKTLVDTISRALAALVAALLLLKFGLAAAEKHAAEEPSRDAVQQR
ncbi:MAG: hypothetical protein AAFW65_07215 [Pseudomonadota bacterium]